MKFTYPARMERIVPQELVLSTTKVPPIHSYGNFASHEATLSPWQENSPFSQCKNRHSRNLKIYFVYNSSTSGFTLPLPCDFGKGWPRLHSEQIWEKSPHGIWNYKEILAKLQLPYTMPILYNKAILALIWDHNFAPTFLPLNISPNFENLVVY